MKFIHVQALYSQFPHFLYRNASPLFFGPDKTKVKIINISAGSAFHAFSALPSLPKMAVTSPVTANQQLSQVEASQ